MNAVNIEYLADHPEAVPIFEAWFEREWEPYYGLDGPGDANADLRNSCRRSELPIALVVICNGKVCGTAALKTKSVSTHEHLTPWLAALLVAPDFRCRGFAGHLITAIEKKARQLGFKHIYVGTAEGSGTPESSLRQRGWRFMEKKPYYISEISIFQKLL